MRLFMPLLLAACAIGPVTAGQPARSAAPAPDFVIHMADGSGKPLSSYKGKVVMLVLMQTTCPHCQHFAQQLSLYQREYGPKGVQVLGAVFDSGAKAGLQHFQDQFAKGYPVGYSDEASVMAWLKPVDDDGYFVPIVVFIDRQGHVVSHHMGDDLLFQDPDGNIRRKLDMLLKPSAPGRSATSRR